MAPLFRHGDAECAYLAGILDGEGCVGIFARKKGHAGYYEMRVRVTNTDLRLLAWLDAHWPGPIHRLKPQNDRDKPQWAINWCGPKAVPVLTDALPFLVLKREQADIALAFQSSIRRTGRRGLTAADKSERAEAHASMRLLNRKGA